VIWLIFFRPWRTRRKRSKEEPGLLRQLRIAGKRKIDLIEEMDSWTSLQHPARRDSSHRESTRRDSNTKQGLSFHPIFSGGKQINAFAVDRSAHYVAVGGYSSLQLVGSYPIPSSHLWPALPKSLPPFSLHRKSAYTFPLHRTSLHLWDLEAAKEKEKEQYVHVPNRYGPCQSDVSSGIADR
jgi:hypothetical protein